MAAGKVTFVGAGCGDPRLLTLRAAEVIAEADYVLFDAEVHPDVLARVKEGTPRVVRNAQMSAETVGSMLAGEAREGRHAVRLAWSDPMLFGHGDVECAAAARHGVPIEIVPGVSAFVAVGAFAAVPLTRSSDASPSVAVLSVTKGHESLHDWEKLATATDTLAILADAECVAEVARSLVFYGRAQAEPIALVANVSLPTQRTVEVTLGEVPLLPQAKSPRVVMLVGERARRIPEIDWLETQPLFGKRVLVTRAREQAGGVAALLRERGADPVLMPTIEIHPPSDPSPMIDAVGNLERYAWVVFTSVNGVERFFDEMARQGKDARALAGAKVAAIGTGTRGACAKRGVLPEVTPKNHDGESLAAELLSVIAKEQGSKPRVLLARAEVGRDVLPQSLRAAGCEVDDVAVYKTRTPPRALLDALGALLEAHEVDAVTFTSSSTVDHLCDALGGDDRAAALLAAACVASIGPVTTETAKKRGVRVDVTAEEATALGLVAAIEKHFSNSAVSTRKPI